MAANQKILKRERDDITLILMSQKPELPISFIIIHEKDIPLLLKDKAILKQKHGVSFFFRTPLDSFLFLNRNIL